MDFNSIDWNAMWREESEHPHWMGSPSEKEVWDKRAAKFGGKVDCCRDSRTRGKDDYISKMLDRIEVRPGWSVLDIGCGPGTLTVPLAKKAESVTALDISSEMLKRLKSNADNDGLSNIRYLNSSWREAFTAGQVGSHDVVVASRSLGSGDVKEAISNIAVIARQAAYITFPIVHLSFDWEAYEAIGRGRRRPARYIYIYNMLFQMGITANVEILHSRIEMQFSSIEEAIDDLQWRTDPFSPDEMAKLRSFLERKFSEQKNSPVLTHKGKSEWALIWWRNSDLE